MKNILIILVAGTFLHLVSCQPEKFGPAVSGEGNLDNITALSGNWKLKSVKQTDEEASIKNSPYVTKDITQDFPFTDFRITLNNSAGAPSDFSTTPGNSPKIIPFPSGKWVVDDIKVPSKVSFVNGTDTLKAVFGSYPSPFSSNFKLKVPRVNAESGKTTMTYEYEFTKQ